MLTFAGKPALLGIFYLVALGAVLGVLGALLRRCSTPVSAGRCRAAS